MTVAAPPPPSALRTVADVFARLGDIPPERIRLNPPPGTATLADLGDPANKLCELVDGTLVEKAVGYPESLLAVFLARLLDEFVEPRALGVVGGPDGMTLLRTGLVRIPDVSFISFARLPGGLPPTEAVPAVAPDLAVEVISEGDRAGELARKRGEYFRAGVRLLWEVNRFRRTVTVYTSEAASRTLTEADTLDGGDVLPGFTLPLSRLFGRYS